MRGERRFPWRFWTWWHAWADRRRNLPSPDATALSETERQIQSAVNIAIRRADQRYSEVAETLKARLEAVEKELKEVYEPELAELQRMAGRRDVRVFMSHGTHLLLLALLTVGETAFNLVAFNVFQEPALYTMLMALAIGLALPICAWAMGVWLRQWPQPWQRTAAKLLTVAAAVIAVLVGINRVRLAYLQEQAPEFVKAHPELNAAFFAVNLVILVGAVLVTYLSHDPMEGFAEARAKMIHASDRQRELQGRLNRRAKELKADVETAKEGGWQLMAYYRMVNRRGRVRVPRYFDEEKEKNYKPEFVSVAVEEFGGETRLATTKPEASRR